MSNRRETQLEQLLARVEALEAQADHSRGVTEMVPPPVATDDTWHKTTGGTFLDRRRAVYNLGVEHGQASSREVADPAPVAGEVAELVADLRIMAAWAAGANQFRDGETLNSAANTLQRLSERLSEKDGVPAPVAGGLVARLIYAICGTNDTWIDWSPEARAAILEQAEWLREQGRKEAADLLEQEAGR
jgi:hypothetical protein